MATEKVVICLSNLRKRILDNEAKRRATLIIAGDELEMNRVRKQLIYEIIDKFGENNESENRTS